MTSLEEARFEIALCKVEVERKAVISDRILDVLQGRPVDGAKLKLCAFTAMTLAVRTKYKCAD